LPTVVFTMSLIDVAIPLAMGLLMAFRPTLFFKPTSTAEENAKKTAKFKKMGCVLIGVAVLYAVIAAARR
jgi:hypothetical protein